MPVYEATVSKMEAREHRNGEGGGEEGGRTPLEMDTGEGEKRQGIDRIPGNAHREQELAYGGIMACRGKSMNVGATWCAASALLG